MDDQKEGEIGREVLVLTSCCGEWPAEEQESE